MRCSHRQYEDKRVSSKGKQFTVINEPVKKNNDNHKSVDSKRRFFFKQSDMKSLKKVLFLNVSAEMLKTAYACVALY